MKQIVTIMAIILMLTSVVSAVTLTEETISTGEGNNLEITILSTDPFPAKPGQPVTMDIRVTNNANRKASNVIIELQNIFPFSPQDGVITIGELLPGFSVTKQIKAIVSKDANTGDVIVPLRASPNGGSAWFEPKKTISIRESDSALAITSAKTVPEYIVPGQKGTLIILLRNDGASTISSIEVELASGDVPIVPSTGSNIQYINGLRTGETQQLEFEIAAKSDAEAGNYAPDLIINYNDFTSQISKTYSIGMKIFEEPSYALNVESRDVYASHDLGNIVLSLANTGSSQLKFTTLKLLPGEGYEIIDGGSSYLGDLDPDDFQTSEYKIKLDSKEDNINLNIAVEFKDSFNKQRIQNEQVSLRVFDDASAMSLGLKPVPNIGGLIFNIMIVSLLLIFWVLMIIDWKRNKNLTHDKKIAWIAILILANLLGAVLYYFIGRKAKK